MSRESSASPLSPKTIKWQSSEIVKRITQDTARAEEEHKQALLADAEREERKKEKEGKAAAAARAGMFKEETAGRKKLAEEWLSILLISSGPATALERVHAQEKRGGSGAPLTAGPFAPRR